MSIDPILKQATELEHKLSFYFVALIFTILGLAIQTAKIGIDSWNVYLEIVSWGTLLISGLLLLSKLECLPVVYIGHYYNEQYEINIKNIKDMIDDPDELSKDFDNVLVGKKKNIKTIKRH